MDKELLLFHLLICSLPAWISAHPVKQPGQQELSVDLSGTGVHRLGRHFINDLCVKTLILSKNNIEHIEADFFNAQACLELLDLSDNRLKLRDFFTLGGESSLKTLILDNNDNSSENSAYFVFVPGEEIDNVGASESDANELVLSRTYSELITLSLRNVSLNSLAKNWSQYFPKLTKLDLSYNKLSEKGLKGVLKELPPSVKELGLEYAGLRGLRTDKLNHVERLRLNGNMFYQILNQCFEPWALCLDDMESMRSLSISDCNIEFIDPNAFRSLNNLLDLDISDNNIHTFDFDSLPSLSSLDLSRNRLSAMPNFEGFKNLSSLALDGLKDPKLFRSFKHFQRMPKLRTISLRSNGLEVIPPSLFENLAALEMLDLSDNRISSLPAWSAHLILRRLVLTSNRIASLDALPIKEAECLEMLVLKNNSITQINVKAFQHFPNKDLVIEI